MKGGGAPCEILNCVNMYAVIDQIVLTCVCVWYSRGKTRAKIGGRAGSGPGILSTSLSLPFIFLISLKNIPRLLPPRKVIM